MSEHTSGGQIQQAKLLSGGALEGGGELPAVPGDPTNLRELPNVLAQRLPGRPCQATVALDLVNPVPGARAGVTVLGLRYAWIGLTATGDGVAVSAATGGDGRAETRCAPRCRWPRARWSNSASAWTLPPRA